MLKKTGGAMNFYTLTAMGANGSIRRGTSTGSLIIDESFSEPADEVTEDSSSLSCCIDGETSLLKAAPRGDDGRGVVRRCAQSLVPRLELVEAGTREKVPDEVVYWECFHTRISWWAFSLIIHV
jgi:hypothetical protein